MKLKTLSCHQFAGICDKSLTFTDGMNIVFGENESGKSTMVDLLSRTLFQSVKYDGRRDKDFKRRCFPIPQRDASIAADFIDGAVTLEAGGEEITLTKEWGAEPRCTLSSQAGALRSGDRIQEKLRELLRYGEGVYASLLFPSQGGAEASLRGILEEGRDSSNLRRDLTQALTMAFAGSGGIPADAIEKKLQENLEAIGGKHWDFQRQAPAPKSGGGRWASGQGAVLKSYYALEDAKKRQAERAVLEQNRDQAARAFREAEAAAEAARADCSHFRSRLTLLQAQSRHREQVEQLTAGLQRLEGILAQWPLWEENLVQGKALREELAGRRLWDQYSAASSLAEQLSALEEELRNTPSPTAEEIKAARAAQADLTLLENQLLGMNLDAVFRLFGGTVEAKSLRTGERLPIENGRLSLREAAVITVPGVMELTLSPAQVDVEEIQSGLAAKRQALAALLAPYGVTSPEALERLARSLQDRQAQGETLRADLRRVLDGTSLEALHAAVSSLPSSPREEESLLRSIAALCGGRDLVSFLAVGEERLEGFRREFGSLEALRSARDAKQQALSRAETEGERFASIPPKLRELPDPASHLAALEETAQQRQRDKEAALEAKTRAVMALEQAPGPDLEELEQAQRVFDETKALLSHWQHMKQVFLAQKESLSQNPMEGLAGWFAHYLRLISGDKVSSLLPEGDKLDVNVYSRGRPLTYEVLSEGTKETIALAFRLAVLEHLFPEGGGFLVLDDPLTDMDDTRMAQSCALLKDCAARHQIIFLTCREDYLPRLGGNVLLL